MLVSSQQRHLKPSQVKAILLPASLSWSERIADWFVINLVLKNLDSIVVDQLLGEMFRSQNGVTFFPNPGSQNGVTFFPNPGSQSGDEEEETEEREV